MVNRTAIFLFLALRLGAFELPAPSAWIGKLPDLEPQYLKWVYAAQQWSDAEGWPEVRDQLLRLVGRVQTAFHPSWSFTRRLNWLVAFLEDNVLRRYVEDQSRIDKALQNYSHNCVSSSILFCTLSEAVQLPVRIVHRSGHVFCLIDASFGSPWAIDFGLDQPLNPYTASAEERFIDPPRLLGYLAQNLIIEAQNRGDWETSLQLAVDRWHLEGPMRDQDAFYKTVYNALIFLLRRGRMAEARRLTTQVRQRYGEHPLLEVVER